MNDVRHLEVNVDGLKVFYREAGRADAPAVLLLHGYPTSSHMFRNLIQALKGQFRVVAPDLPGFGQSAMPARDQFRYTFESLADVMNRFSDVVGLRSFAVYMFDYGAPVGLRMALKHPERVTAIVSQNGNAYDEGLSAGWASMKEFWKAPTEAARDEMRSAFTPESTRYQYMTGVSDGSVVSPDGIALDDFYLARPGAHEVQLAFFQDYGANVALYPAFQEYLRTKKPPVLAVWGKNDPYFLPAGAEAFRRDVPDAEVHLLDTGHFALETHGEEIAKLMVDFLGRKVPA